jgi:hypothetical protein
MKAQLRRIVLGAGALNLLFALFHVYLCYRIHILYGTTPVYPLLQMLSVGGTLMVFFLAYTSLMAPEELTSTRIGGSVIMLNILLYLSRVIGEIVLFPKPGILIIGLCSFISALYIYIYLNRGKAANAADVIPPATETEAYAIGSNR